MHRVLCTWWLLGLAVNGHRWDQVGQFLPWEGLRKHYCHLAGSLFLARKAAWALNGCMTTKSADYCMLVNEWVWLRSRVCLLRLEVDLDSVLESKLWRCSVLKACI